MFPNLVEKLDNYKRTKIKKQPAMANRASYIGDDCVRKLYYLRVDWDKAEDTSLDLQYIFEEGNQQEQNILADLKSSGINVIRQQESFSWPQHQITGSIDGMILMDDGSLIPFDAKSMSPHVWEKIDSSDIETLKRFSWTKKYLAQIVIYMLMSNQERGILLFKNKSNGRFKQMNFILSDFLDLAEEQIQKADKINEAVANKTAPERTTDNDNCIMCQFRLHCLPDQNLEALEFIDNEELEILLKRKEELKELAKEFDDISDQIKETVKGKSFVCGDWHISGSWIDKKESIVKASRYWKPKIQKVG